MRRAPRLLLAAVLSASAGLADEPPQSLPIATLLEDRASYHLQQVLLQGTVRHVEEIAPYFLSSGTACYGAYRFMLVDDTGMVPVSVLGICGRPVIRPPEVSEGDAVLIEAAIEALDAANRSAEEAGTEGKDINLVRAVAKRITRLGH